jgi:glycosyltransferase involved in cell wall biosynthesis
MREHGIADRVRHFKALSAGQLTSLYHFASVFVYPSLYEGFGLPLLEAFACGCPVAASRSSCIPEVAGDAAEIFDPRLVDSVAAAVERVLCNPSRSRQLVEAGMARLSFFSWEKTAAKTLEVYRKAS